MKTKRSETYTINILLYLTLIPLKLGKHVKLHGRRYIILATATGMIMASAGVLIGCKSSGGKPKYTAEQWQYMKHKSRSTGSK